MKLINNPRIYITKGAVLYIGTVVDTAFHKHPAIQITISLENKFAIHFKQDTVTTDMIILNSNTEHKLIGRDGIQALILIEPESVYSSFLKKHIGKNEYLLLEMKNHIISSLNTINENDFSLTGLIKKLCLTLDDSPAMKVIHDNRINEIINFIESIDEKKITVRELASHVSLSESRLQHLFKSQTGISIKKYLQWKRLIDGVAVIIGGKDFTYSSHEAGFSDSAHMSRTFKESIGLNLSEIFHSSRSVQVILLDK